METNNNLVTKNDKINMTESFERITIKDSLYDGI